MKEFDNWDRIFEVTSHMADPDDVSATRATLMNLPAGMAEVWLDQLEKKQGLAQLENLQSNVTPQEIPRVKLRTHDVIVSLLKFKEYKGLKEGTLKTYEKRFNQFAREFEWLSEKPEPIMDYLNQFDGETRRHKRNHHDALKMLYKHAIQNFGWPSNPLDALERPLITEKPIKTLSLEQVYLMDKTPESLIERVSFDLTLGHGWRQIEVRRIQAGDALNIKDGIIWCRGKERDEFTPILPETEQRLRELAHGFSSNELIILSKRTYRGKREPLGEDGMAQLLGRLYARAGLAGFTGHDTRRTFATLVTTASHSDTLAMRLMRDKRPGQNDRYINYPMHLLREDLERYSPLRLIRQKETGSSRGPEPANISGGDGGELNSPSRRSCPEYATSLVSFFILPG